MRRSHPHDPVKLAISPAKPGRIWEQAIECLLLALVLFAFSAVRLQTVSGISSGIIISQIYGGGGSSSDSYKNDYIELFNRGAVAVNLTGWSLQYASASGNSWDRVDLSGSIGPGQYYLIKLAAGSSGTKDLPAADATGILNINASAGKIALLNNRNFLDGTLACSAGFASAGIVDFVGYGGIANCYEGSAPAPAGGNASATVRLSGGCSDTDNNGLDFSVGVPLPHNSLTPLKPCNATITAQTDLSITTTITQSTSASVPPRGIVRLMIEVFNGGTVAAQNVITTESLPAGFIDISADKGGVFLGGDISLPVIPQLNPGERISFTVTAKAPQIKGRFISRAVVNSNNFDPVTSNNVSLQEIIVAAGAMFDEDSVRVTISNSSICSSTFQVEVKLTNIGMTAQLDTSDAEYSANLSPESIYTGSCSATKGRCRGNRNSSYVRWDGQINAGETVTITYSVRVVGNLQTQINFCIKSNILFDSDNDMLNDDLVTVTNCALYGCLTVTPVEPELPPTSAVSVQKPGSILIYNLYTSSSFDPDSANTRINITNTTDYGNVTVHLFFIDGNTCQVSDSYLCLTTNQTTSFLVSDMDPGVTGYLVAIAVDGLTGCPINFNYLVGDEYIQLQSGHAANLGAESFAAIAETPCECDGNMPTVEIALDGENYNLAPRTLAASNIISPVDNNSTLMVVNRVGGNLSLGLGSIGLLSGVLFDDLEKAFSFSVSAGCQFREFFSNSFPRTAPRINQIISSGHSGWMRFFAHDDVGIIGATITYNPSSQSIASAFNGGSSLHKLSFTNSARFVLPTFPSACVYETEPEPELRRSIR